VSLSGRVVVGAALLRNGRVLAARRCAPEALAGGWEFPGGKVEAGESETAAVVRECREELGVEVICRTRVPGEWQVNAEWVLRVYLAEIAAGEALPGADHDQLRWLSRAELFDVDWLPADLPAAVSLAGLLPG
jgi:8-oxo-dGTP diphosphatase